MNCVAVLLMGVGMCAATLNASPNDTEVSYGADQLLNETFDSLRDFDDIAIADVDHKSMPDVLARLKEMPKLATLKFHGCDLSNVGPTNPVPEKVRTVLVAGGRISQGTVRWLSKFPKGTEIVFGGQDMRTVSFEDLRKSSWLTFDNCTMSKSAVAKLVETMTQVTFKETTLVDD